ncbi:hypothetical protein Q9233_013887 [Columba guinea]|nr:hypothetical protein Q9233_013887 [Columba guinea]
MGSGDWKSSKTEQRLPLEVGIESNEATARDMGTRLRRWSDANSEQRRLECPLWREQERLGLMSGELGMEEPKTRPGETGGWSELHPELLPSSTSVYYTCILSKTQTWIRMWVGLDRLSVRAPGVLASIATTDAYLYF